MEKKRGVRPVLVRANGPNLNGQLVSSDEEEVEPAVVSRPLARTSRRAPKVDFSKLETASLQKYRKVFKLGDAPASSSKDDLIPAIARHFASQAVDEEETLLKFALALHKRKYYGKPGMTGSKKPRNGPKKALGGV